MQVEIRSSIHNVQRIATHFGGGGHEFAAGFTIKEFTPERIEELLNLCAEANEKGKE